ncbi:hypothetical protein SAMN04487992_104323 [Cellulophaga baltica]|uniref:Uncharacterized protein n=1 Tax=Cellulophaga baltica TaxID=76594 RepID=A0A1G7GE69_9FLAO|nr:hypothetical protein SAMN04487992_104323 [Cellulophaga baltica]
MGSNWCTNLVYQFYEKNLYKINLTKNKTNYLQIRIIYNIIIHNLYFIKNKARNTIDKKGSQHATFPCQHRTQAIEGKIVLNWNNIQAALADQRL